MPEFDINADYMQEGYWESHSPDDDCVFVRLPEPRPGMVAVIRDFWADRGPAAAAKLALVSLAMQSDREFVRRFREGEDFIGADYPLGTIVRFDKETLSMGSRAKTAVYQSEPWYMRKKYWGVVMQKNYPEPNTNVLMSIMDGFVDLRRGWVDGSKFSAIDPTLEVGKVIHTRRAENSDWNASESFSRVLSADIWALGIGVRRSVEERSTSRALGRLLQNPD